VATGAGISRSTLSLLERGETITVTTLIQVLRFLNLLDLLKTFEATETISPLALAKQQQKKRKRASGKSSQQPNTQTDW
jgi:transcriptional regulator with XRE-family HTH domain